MTLILIAAASLCALCAALAMPAFIRVLTLRDILDVPDERSLHAKPTPRAGGVVVVGAMILGTAFALVITSGVIEGDAHPSLLLYAGLTLGTVVAYALLGLAEDIIGLSVRTRLLTQLLLALAMGWSAAQLNGLPPIMGIAAVVISVPLVNATNFMDGANGVITVHTALTLMWFLIITSITPTTTLAGLRLVLVCLVGALVGFLPFNAPRARVFLGDVGSYALGAATSVTIVVLTLVGGYPLEAIFAPALPLFADTGLTLIWRKRAGYPLCQPHKHHRYQRLVSLGWPHWGVTVLIAGVSMVCCLLTLPVLLGASPSARMICLLLIAIVLAIYLAIPTLVAHRSGIHAQEVGA